MKRIFLILILIMGNDDERIKIENNHSEELKRIYRIYTLKEDGKRKINIEELAVKYNYELKKEELENLAEEARNRHIENIQDE